MINAQNKFTTNTIAGALTFGIMLSTYADEIKSWPAETRNEAIPRFISAGEDSIAGQDNWSGLHWNAQSETLWLVRNRNDNGKGEVRSYRLENNLWNLSSKVELPNENGDHLDLEGVTQTGENENQILVLAEDNQQIRMYDVNSIESALLETWDISQVETAIDDSFEGIAYIPFDKKGVLAQDAENFFAGYVLVSIQEQDESPGFTNNGNIYILKLLNSNLPGQSIKQVELVDIFEIPLNDTRGLEFDQSTRILYAIDKNGMVAIKIPRTFELEVITQFESPGPRGLEGIALTPANSANYWMMLSDDDNDDNHGAVLEYTNFRPVMHD